MPCRMHAAIGRLGQVCDRWIYTACLCFGLDLEEQERSGFRYGYSVYQAEYSRNLLFKSGAQMEDLFDRILDRTRSRLDIPAIRTIFGLKNRPHHNRGRAARAGDRDRETTVRPELVPDQLRAAPAEGLYQGRARAALRGHRAQRQRTALPPQPGQLRPRSSPGSPAWRTGSPPPWTAPISASCPTGCSMSCRCPPRPGPARIAGIDLNKPRIRAALAAALALAPAPGGFTVAEFAAKVRADHRARRLHHPAGRL